MSTHIEEANYRFQQAVDRDDAARFLRCLPRAVLLGVADLNYIEEAGNASMIEALLTERFGEVTTTQSPMLPVVDADVIDALMYRDVWRAAGDSLDWDVAVIAYEVRTDVDVLGVRVPAGLYAREVTGDGRHVVAHRWTDRDALVAQLADVEARHAAHLHIVHARPVFFAAHAAQIDRYARAVIALVETDERDGGPLYDAPCGAGTTCATTWTRTPTQTAWRCHGVPTRSPTTWTATSSWPPSRRAPTSCCTTASACSASTRRRRRASTGRFATAVTRTLWASLTPRRRAALGLR